MPIVLPPEFRFGHDLCLFLHDYLAAFVGETEAQGLYFLSFPFKNQEEAETFPQDSGEEAWEWLAKHRPEHRRELTWRLLVLALLSDFCHFVYEALECSERGKLTVAYALLRKPLKENLLVLEWMLADGEDFLDRFLAGDPDALNTPVLSAERKRELIRGALNHVLLKSQDAGFLYAARYDKRATYGFEPLWQQATHLVTTRPAIRTDPQNFNFIFLTPGIPERQWEHLYTVLPPILDHAAGVVEALIATYAELDLDVILRNASARAAGMALWVDEKTQGDDFLEKTMSSLAEVRPATCEACDHGLLDPELYMLGLYRLGKVMCMRCLTTPTRERGIRGDMKGWLRHPLEGEPDITNPFGSNLESVVGPGSSDPDPSSM